MQAYRAVAVPGVPGRVLEVTTMYSVYWPLFRYTNSQVAHVYNAYSKRTRGRQKPDAAIRESRLGAALVGCSSLLHHEAPTTSISRPASGGTGFIARRSLLRSSLAEELALLSLRKRPWSNPSVVSCEYPRACSDLVRADTNVTRMWTRVGQTDYCVTNYLMQGTLCFEILGCAFSATAPASPLLSMAQQRSIVSFESFNVRWAPYTYFFVVAPQSAVCGKFPLRGRPEYEIVMARKGLQKGTRQERADKMLTPSSSLLMQPLEPLSCCESEMQPLTHAGSCWPTE